MSGFSWSGLLAPARRLAGDPGRLPYLIAFLALIVLFCVNQAFWLTNDDVSMSLISDGSGISAVASPRLVLTNIAWGYLVYRFPDIGGIRGYTWLTYLALALACFAMAWGFMRSQVDHRLAATVLVLVFGSAFIYPQFTLVAGYLAGAAALVACNAVETRSTAAGWFAACLVVLSGLVRADETALVLLVAAPFCIGPLRAAWRSDDRRRWIVIIVAAAAVFLGFQLFDYFTFSSGGWDAYAQDYALRTGFTDFKLSIYFREHPALLKGSGFSVNDMRLISDWFYLDTQIFSPQNLHRLLDRLPWQGRIHASLASARELLEPFTDTLTLALCALLVFIGAFQRRKRDLLAAAAVLLLVMIVLWAAGRPGITRIYIPAFAALLLLGITRMDSERRDLHPYIGVLALSVTLLFCGHLTLRNQALQFKSRAVQAETCKLPQDSLVIVWGGSYPLSSEYPAFRPIGAACPLDYYSFGEFSLAPYALEHLHQYTGGRDFVSAVLSGQSFDFISDREQLTELQVYFRQHYSTRLIVTPGSSNEFFSVYRVSREQLPELRAPRP